MKDPHPDLIPLWTHIVRKHFTKEPDHLFSAEIHTVGKIKLNWFSEKYCFVGEAFHFNTKKIREFRNSSTSNDDLAFGGGLFGTLNDFYRYKEKLYRAVQKFEKEEK